VQTPALIAPFELSFKHTHMGQTKQLGHTPFLIIELETKRFRGNQSAQSEAAFYLSPPWAASRLSFVQGKLIAASSALSRGRFFRYK
jgi:hypothetical protein